MGEGLRIYGANNLQVNLYYIIVTISFIYFNFKYLKSPFLLYIVILFYFGLSSAINKNIHDIYKIVTTFLGLYFLVKTKAISYIKSNNSIAISFLIFSAIFIATSIVNGDNKSLTFSQYSRYLILFTIFLIFQKYKYNPNFKSAISLLIYRLLICQITLSIVKFFIMGPTESIVGTVSSQGGALATLIPILGLIFLWIYKQGKFNKWDWLFILGLMFIGFVSVKRAIWFIMPLFLLLMLYYVPQKRINAKLSLFGVILIPLAFFLGIKMNPTLNPEKSYWGSFDLEYAINYAVEYTFGNNSNQLEASGRGGATFMLLNKIKNLDFNAQDLIGSGLRNYYANDYEKFSELNTGINHKGSATGAFQFFITGGILSLVALVIFAVAIIKLTAHKRLRNVLFILFIWEYFFYTGSLFRETSLIVLIVYIISFSDTAIWRINKNTLNSLANNVS